MTILTKPFRLFWHEILSQQERWILWLPVPAACGIGFFFSLLSEPESWLGVAGLMVLGLLAPIFSQNRKAFYFWLVVFLMMLGFTAAQFRTAMVAAPVLQKRSWKAQDIKGRIIDVDPLAKAYRITLDNLTFSEPVQKTMPERVRIKLKNNDPAEPKAGDIISIHAVLLPLSSPVAPGAFDFQRHAYFKQLGSTGYALSDLVVETREESGFFFENLRRIIRERVAQANVADKDTQGLMTAFMVGDSKAISEHDWDIARDSGIAHLIAISGSHFVMIVGVSFFLIRALLAAIPAIALRFPIKKIAALFGMAAAVFYLMLIGAPVPAQRATVMSCVVLFAILIDRDPFTLRIAALAAMILLLLKPEVLVGASFQLSFAAVIGLIAFFESTKEWWRRIYREEKWSLKISMIFVSVFLTTLVASLATAPFALYHFLRVPLLSGLIANMVAVPMSSFITFPFGLLACLLMPFGLEKGALWLMAQSIEMIMTVAETVSKWPHMILTVDAWPVHLLVIIALGGLWLCLWHGRMRWLGVIPIIIALSFIPQAARVDVLVSPDTKLAAVRGLEGGILLSSKRRGKFVRNAWIEREGSKGHDFWPAEGVSGPLTCDNHVCYYRAKGTTVAFVKDGGVFAGECEKADIVFVLKDVKQSFWRGSCKDTVVIDKGLIYRRGAYAVYLEDGQPPRIVNSNDLRGKRPWAGYY